MKDKIKEILKEEMMKNSLGIVVTKPDQKVIVLRGIPGSGKSTKAKQIVGNGIIHSTDDVIEASGDYNKFFADMVTSKDFTPLSKAHSTNLKNATASMEKGISPVVIDNTNIKQNESKGYITAALKLGISDDNISFIDIGTGGLSAEQLAKRNTHGVPLEKIEQMIASYTGQGPLSLKSVLDSKDMYKQSDVLYSAVVLDTPSKNYILDIFADRIPKGWSPIAHHMTIAFGKGVKDKTELGKEVVLTATEVGISDMAMAIKVSGYESANKMPHITIAVNPNGGKAVMSNDITKWQPIKHFIVTGKVTEIKKSKV